MNCFSQKFIFTKQSRKLSASSSNIFYQRWLPLTSVIIGLGDGVHFFANKDWITNYKKHQHLFQTWSEKKVTVQSYEEVISQLELSDWIINALNISHVSWASDLGFKLFSIILLAKKEIDIFLSRTDQSSEIHLQNELVRIADIMDN